MATKKVARATRRLRVERPTGLISLTQPAGLIPLTPRTEPLGCMMPVDEDGERLCGAEADETGERFEAGFVWTFCAAHAAELDAERAEEAREAEEARRRAAGRAH